MNRPVRSFEISFLVSLTRGVSRAINSTILGIGEVNSKVGRAGEVDSALSSPSYSMLGSLGFRVDLRFLADVRNLLFFFLVVSFADIAFVGAHLWLYLFPLGAFLVLATLVDATALGTLAAAVVVLLAMFN
jgi:hypothetical protein